jgi:hypothetical protein
MSSQQELTMFLCSCCSRSKISEARVHRVSSMPETRDSGFGSPRESDNDGHDIHNTLIELYHIPC